MHSIQYNLNSNRYCGRNLSSKMENRNFTLFGVISGIFSSVLVLLTSSLSWIFGFSNSNNREQNNKNSNETSASNQNPFQETLTPTELLPVAKVQTVNTQTESRNEVSSVNTEGLRSAPVLRSNDPISEQIQQEKVRNTT